MANFDTIKTAIDANIKTNGTQDITGGKMNSILKQMVDATEEQLTGLESELEKAYSGNDLIVKKFKSTSGGVTSWAATFIANKDYIFKVKFSNAVTNFVLTNVNTGVNEVNYSGAAVTEYEISANWLQTCPSVNVYLKTADGNVTNVEIRRLSKGTYDNVLDNAVQIATNLNDIANLQSELEKAYSGNDLIVKKFKSTSGGVTSWAATFIANKDYIFKVKFSNAVTNFVLTNVNTGVNEVNYSGAAVTEYEISANWLQTCPSVNVYLKTADGNVTNVEIRRLSKGTYDNVLDNAVQIATNLNDIAKLNQYLGLKNHIRTDNVVLSKTSILQMADVTFKRGTTYLFTFDCDYSVPIEDGAIKIFNSNSEDNAVISSKGNLKGMSVSLTFDSDSKGFVVASNINRVLCRIAVYSIENIEQKKITILRQNNITIPASQSTIILYNVIYGLAPDLVKGLEYHLHIDLDSDVKINDGYLDVLWDSTYEDKQNQSIHITNYSSQLNGLDIAFVPTHNMTQINATIWLDALSESVTGKAYIYRKRNYVDAFEVLEGNISNTAGFLASYTNNGEPGKLKLALSKDGMHFRKLTNDAIFDAKLDGGFQHDIAIYEKDGTYYLIATSNKSENESAVFTIFQSENLANWSLYSTIKIPFAELSFDDGNSYDSAWAPEILNLYGKEYLSFAICEKWEGSLANSIVKSYIAELNDELNYCYNIKRISLNKDLASSSFDITIYADSDTLTMYAYEHDGGIYKSVDGGLENWAAVGCIPLTSHGYTYMEGGTILKEKGWFYIYGDGITSEGNVNNMLCWKTKDFTQFELFDKQFDTRIRHPKVIKIDYLSLALAQNLFVKDKLL